MLVCSIVFLLITIIDICRLSLGKVYTKVRHGDIIGVIACLRYYAVTYKHCTFNLEGKNGVPCTSVKHGHRPFVLICMIMHFCFMCIYKCWIAKGDNTLLIFSYESYDIKIASLLATSCFSILSSLFFTHPYSLLHIGRAQMTSFGPQVILTYI